MKSIIIDPNPILHTRTTPVRVFDAEIASLVSEMLDTMRRSKGMGLAAVQIGIAKNIAVVEIPENERAKEQGEAQSPYVLINAKIIHASQTLAEDTEGCLSLPNIEVRVTRPTNIMVRSFDEHGTERTISASHLFSRVIQHEIDHCNGILITDHGTPIIQK